MSQKILDELQWLDLLFVVLTIIWSLIFTHLLTESLQVTLRSVWVKCFTKLQTSGLSGIWIRSRLVVRATLRSRVGRIARVDGVAADTGLISRADLLLLVIRFAYDLIEHVQNVGFLCLDMINVDQIP